MEYEFLEKVLIFVVFLAGYFTRFIDEYFEKEMRKKG